MAILHGTIPDRESIQPTFDRLFDEVAGYILHNHNDFAGPPTALWYDGDQEQEMHVAAAMPVARRTPDTYRIHVETLPAIAQMASVIHRGPFATMGAAYGGRS